MVQIDYDKYADLIHKWNCEVGWWDDPKECVYQKIQLIVTEVAEATEGARRDLMDTHLPDRKMEEVEYADALIRTLDLGGKFNLIFRGGKNIAPHLCKMKWHSAGKLHLGIVKAAVLFAGQFESHYYDLYLHHRVPSDFKAFHIAYTRLIYAIEKVAMFRGCDLEGAMIAKMAFNKTRLDHKRESRDQSDGKKF